MKKNKLLVFIDLIQDIDTLRPLIEKFKRDNELEFEIWITHWLKRKKPDFIQELKEKNYTFKILSRLLLRLGITPSLKKFTCLITATESSLKVHQAAHQLTIKMSKFGFTYTLQHGLENIGLTYFDKGDFENIYFASQNIFLWGTTESLHEKCSNNTIKKCISVGRTRNSHKAIFKLNLENTHPIVSIFENCHWDRYSSEYKETFIKSIKFLAEKFPNVNFLIKPHIAGNWLFKSKNILPYAQNIIYCNPYSSEWKTISADTIIYHSKAVITTPSTIALDAAYSNKPVAILAFDTSYPFYMPLHQIKTTEQLQSYLKDALNDNLNIIKNNTKFINKVDVGGDSLTKIINRIKSDLNKKV